MIEYWTKSWLVSEIQRGSTVPVRAEYANQTGFLLLLACSGLGPAGNNGRLLVSVFLGCTAVDRCQSHHINSCLSVLSYRHGGVPLFDGISAFCNQTERPGSLECLLPSGDTWHDRIQHCWVSFIDTRDLASLGVCGSISFGNRGYGISLLLAPNTLEKWWRRYLCIMTYCSSLRKNGLAR
jgi:hypothetical protein